MYIYYQQIIFTGIVQNTLSILVQSNKTGFFLFMQNILIIIKVHFL